MKSLFKIIPLIFLFFALTAQEGCQTTSGMKKISAKQSVKQDMIAEIQTEIMGLGETPLTKDEATTLKGIDYRTHPYYCYIEGDECVEYSHEEIIQTLKSQEAKAIATRLDDIKAYCNFQGIY